MRFQPVKTAVIGCGMISDIYLHNLKETFSIIDLVGCADQVEEKARRQAEKYELRQMTTEEILSDPSIELVLNLTYPASHYEINRRILEAGKHCYCEKMMADTLEQARELTALSHEMGVFFAVAPDTFLGASQQTARLLVDRGMIGQPIQAVVTLCREYQMIKSTEDDAWRKFSVMYPGGGIPYDMGGYYLHQLFNLLGPVSDVCGFAYTRREKRPYLNPRHERFNDGFQVDTPNTLSASLRFCDGTLCTLAISSEYTSYEQRFELLGSEGLLTMGDPNNFGDKLYLKKRGEALEFPLSHPYAENSRGIGAADMAWAIRTHRSPRLSCEMGLHALEVIEAIRGCTEDGRTRKLETAFARPAPISTEYYTGASQERSLYLL
ncbi:MAG: Gfo/Idh/MocA family oxidoreductase [Eubacteriales bacterium]|nr:Gfo/Idh/MocA family oxidoreductase [Eubacteriales bacterium]